jgi:hypothetical protein
MMKRRCKLERARTPIETATRPLESDASDMTRVDDRDRGTCEDFPDASKGGNEGRMVLDGYGPKGSLEMLNLCGGPGAHPNEVRKPKGRRKCRMRSIRHIAYK